MHLYNDKGNVVKYNTIYEIKDDFYNVRHNLYGLRKQHMLDQLKKDLLIIQSKIRFITEIVNETLIINKQSKKDIIQKLYSKGYLMINKEQLIESETDEYQTYKDTITTLPSFDYILKLPIYSLSEDSIDQLTKTHTSLQESYDEINEKSISEMWIEELDHFLKMYKRMKKNM